jgi:EcsC protein family
MARGKRSDEALDGYEQEQLQAIAAWKNRSPPTIGRVAGSALAPLAWTIGKVVPPSAIEGALKGADWAALQTLSEERVMKEAGVASIEELQRLELKHHDVLADSFHRWAVGFAVVEGGVAGAAGIAAIPVDIPAVIALALRTVRGIGICYGYVDKTEVEREFVLGVIAAGGANSIKEKPMHFSSFGTSR